MANHRTVRTALREVPEVSPNAADLLALQAAALVETPTAVMLTHMDGTILWVNSAFERLTGYASAEIAGQNPRVLKSGRVPREIYEQMWRTILAGRTWRGELINRRKDGTLYDEELTVTPLRTATGEITHFVAIKMDITDRKCTERETAFKNTLLEAQTETAVDAILAVNECKRVVLSNNQFCSMWGVPPEMARPGNDNHILDFVIGQIEEPKKFLERVNYLYNHREEKAKDEVRLKDGRVLDRYSAPLVDAEGIYHGRIWYFRDVTERIQAEERMQLWSRVLDQSVEGIFVCDPKERILLVNKAFERLTGFSAAEAVGQTPRILKSGRQDRTFYEAMWASISQNGSWQGEMSNRRKNGELFVEWLSVSAVYDRNGVATHYVGIFSDITARKHSEEQILHLAQHDALTDLPNRVLLMDRLNQLTKAAKRRNSKVAVAFIDLDRFKDVNDSLGHDAGDQLLQTIAKRLAATVREEDTVARIGGDEFVVIFQGLRDASNATLLAEKLHSCVAAEPVLLNGYDVTVTASIGISVFPDDARNAAEMIRNADAAMYQAKNLGRNAYHVYTSDLNQRALEMLSLEAALRRAIERHEFVLHYQPQMRLADDSVAGVEALIRWKHPEMGLVMPGRFIGLAEERGLIVPIGNWVIEEVCRQAAEWRRSEIVLPLAINVSAVQLRQKDFVEQLISTVRKHGITPATLELELTESIMLRDAKATLEILEQLHDFGFRLSIDDFGTGYSSLSYLRRFPIDRIKIDQSFVHDSSAGGIISAIIALARSLKVQVIAEGVQTLEQLAMLRKQGCDEVQGFVFSPPTEAGELEKLVRERAEAGLRS